LFIGLPFYDKGVSSENLLPRKKGLAKAFCPLP